MSARLSFRSTDKNYSEEYVLYRIMPLLQLVDILVSGENKLVHTNRWEDPFESLIQHGKLKITGMSRKTLNLNGDRWYGQCWTTIENSDSLWRAFTHNKEVRCVKVKTCSSNLLNSCKASSEIFQDYQIDHWLEEVKYVEANSEKDYLNIIDKKVSTIKNSMGSDYQELRKAYEFALLMTKRKSFAYEKEVRLLFYDERKKRYRKNEVISYPINAEELFEEIEFDPWTPTYLQNSLKEMVKRLGYKKNSIKFSPLYNILGSEERVFFNVDMPCAPLC